MSHRPLLVLMIAAIATLNVAAQGQPPAAPPTYEQVVARTWKNLHESITIVGYT